MDIVGIKWIDWRNDGRLLATAGSENVIKIFDIRTGKFDKTIPKLYGSNCCTDFQVLLTL